MIKKLAARLALPLLLGAADPGVEPVQAAKAVTLHVSLEGLRSQKGWVRLCLTAQKRYFPDCSGDPQAIRLSSPASMTEVDIPAVHAGQYALSVIHDENGNGKLDTLVGIPREGFGFSRNPAIRFGPPRFADALIRLEAGVTGQIVKIRYLL